MLNVPYDVKRALKNGNLRKNYKIKVYGADGTLERTIDNDSLVSESVKIDERMVTGKVLEFGLCEGSSLEFEYFNHPNINGKRLEVLLSVQYDNNSWYDIPMGWFDVDQCPMQWDTGIYKVTAFNKLKSEYLNAKANSLLVESYDNPNLPVTVYDIRNTLLNDYEIHEEEKGRIEISRDPYGAGAIRKISGNSTKFISKWGIDTPLNYYRYAGAETSTSITVYPYVVASESSAILDPTKIYHVKYLYDMEILEQLYYDAIQWRVRESFDDFDFMDRFMIPQPISGPYYESFLGWHQYCGIKLTFVDNSIEWYSTIAYNNNLTDVVGTFKDLEQSSILNCTKIEFAIPLILGFNSNANLSGTNVSLEFAGTTNYRYWKDANLTQTEAGSFSWYDPNGNLTDYQWTITGWCELYEYTNLSDAEKIQLIPADMPEFTLREITSAAYETVCKYGQLDRVTDLFKGVELNQGGLHPADGLYPANGLYPSGQSHIFPSSYQKLWTDTGGEQSFRYLIITYKTTEIVDGQEQEVEKKLQRTVNANGTTNYNMSDNWLFRNLIWTAEEVGAYADAMVAKMQSITWFPFEMWCVGLPYLETGDALEIVDREGNTHISYILNRQLNGIHDLQDTFVNGELDIF